MGRWWRGRGAPMGGGDPVPGLRWAEGGRRWGLHGDVVLGGGNGGGSRRVAFLGKGKEERL